MTIKFSRAFKGMKHFLGIISLTRKLYFLIYLPKIWSYLILFSFSILLFLSSILDSLQQFFFLIYCCLLTKEQKLSVVVFFTISRKCNKQSLYWRNTMLWISLVHKYIYSCFNINMLTRIYDFGFTKREKKRKLQELNKFQNGALDRFLKNN